MWQTSALASVGSGVSLLQEGLPFLGGDESLGTPLQPALCASTGYLDTNSSAFPNGTRLEGIASAHHRWNE